MALMQYYDANLKAETLLLFRLENLELRCLVSVFSTDMFGVLLCN